MDKKRNRNKSVKKSRSISDKRTPYIQPTLNGSPGFKTSEEESEIHFSPVKKLEFSSSVDDAKQLDFRNSPVLQEHDLISFENDNELEIGRVKECNCNRDKETIPTTNGLPNSTVAPHLNNSPSYVIARTHYLSSSNSFSDNLNCDDDGDGDDNQQFSHTPSRDDEDEESSPSHQALRKTNEETFKNCNSKSCGLIPKANSLSVNSEKDILNPGPLNTDSTFQEQSYPTDEKNKLNDKQLQPITSSGVLSNQSFVQTNDSDKVESIISAQSLVQNVPCGFDRKDDIHSKPHVIQSKSDMQQSMSDESQLIMSNTSSSNETQTCESLNNLLTVEADQIKTKCLPNNCKEDKKGQQLDHGPGDAVQEIELLRGQLHSVMHLSFKSKIDTTLFDYSQSDNDFDLHAIPLHSTLTDVSSLSNEATDAISWTMGVAHNSDDPVNRLHNQPTSSLSMNKSQKLFSELPPQQIPIVNQSQYSIYLDNIKLKEEFEKERFRRKHCEKYIEQLNAKILDVQEQLAVAVSANSKKEFLMENLDKQLEKIIENWKKQDLEKNQMIREFQREKNIQSQIIDDHRKLTAVLQTDFNLLVEELNTEKEKCLQLNQKLEEMELKKCSLEKELNKEREQHHDKLKEVENKNKQLESKEATLSGLTAKLRQEQDEALKREEELLRKIEEISEDHHQMWHSEKEKYENLLRNLEIAEERITSQEEELTELNKTIKQLLQEKENLNSEMKFIEARHENNQKELEKRLESQMEKEISTIIEDFEAKQENIERSLQKDYQQKVSSLMEQHKSQMNETIFNYQKLQQQNKDFNIQLQHTKRTLQIYGEENQALRISNKRLESQRVEALSRFQTIMQLHWNNAISVLENPPTSEAVGQSPSVNGTESCSNKLVKQSPNIVCPFPQNVKSSGLGNGQQIYLQPQTSSPNNDAMNIYSFTLNPEDITGMESKNQYNDNGDKGKLVETYLHGLNDHHFKTISPPTVEDTIKNTANGPTSLADFFPPVTQDISPETDDNQNNSSNFSRFHNENISPLANQQTSRQDELHYFVKMLLNRIPNNRSLSRTDNIGNTQEPEDNGL